MTLHGNKPERYRSGHNGADSKSDGGRKSPQGFESLPLRHINEKADLTSAFSLMEPAAQTLVAAIAAYSTTPSKYSISMPVRSERITGK